MPGAARPRPRQRSPPTTPRRTGRAEGWLPILSTSGSLPRVEAQPSRCCASTMVVTKGGGVHPTTRELDLKLTRNYAVIIFLAVLGVGLSITEVC